MTDLAVPGPSGVGVRRGLPPPTGLQSDHRHMLGSRQMEHGTCNSGLATEVTVAPKRPDAPRIAGLCRLYLAALLMSTFGACGGDSIGTGSSPAYPVAGTLDFTISPMVNNGTTVAFQWSGANASGYTLQIGSTRGTADVALIDAGASTSVTWAGVPIGNFYARVIPRQGTRFGPPSNDVNVTSIDARQMIDALIFGRGPLAPPGNTAGPVTADQMEGWQPGSSFVVKLGVSLPAAVTSSLQKTVAQIGPATMGAVQATALGGVPEPVAWPGPGEVTVIMSGPDDVKSKCSCSNCVGCAYYYLQGRFIQRGRILISTSAQDSAAAHELGHILGLAHIISAAGVRPPFTMGITPDGQYAPSGQLDVLEPATIRMLETLYGMGLTAGSTRAQFEAAGLVPPETPGASVLGKSDRRSRGYVVRSEGIETVVVKAFCQ